MQALPFGLGGAQGAVGVCVDVAQFLGAVVAAGDGLISECAWYVVVDGTDAGVGVAWRSALRWR